MDRLNKYSKSGSFYFTVNDRLSKVCNAPDETCKYGGLYVIYAIKKNVAELVYIGISGRIDKVTGKLMPRKDGIRGRIVNGKRDGKLRREFWLRQIQLEKIDALKIDWYVVHDQETFQDNPEIIEKTLIAKYNPLWNKR